MNNFIRWILITLCGTISSTLPIIFGIKSELDTPIIILLAIFFFFIGFMAAKSAAFHNPNEDNFWTVG